jgi:hypothetical protein
VDFIGPFVVKSWVLETDLMAEFQVIDIQIIGQLDGSVD